MARHRVELPDAQIARLEQYWRLRQQLNAKLNLTRHTDYETFVGRDLVDSLAFAAFLQKGENVLDVGTGAGVPGVVLAIVRSDLDVTLCESAGKKAKAVGEMIEQLRLDVAVVHGRAEDLLIERRYNTLVVRAVAKLRRLLEWFAPHWGAFDRMLLIQGPSWVDQRAEARHHGLLRDLTLRKLTSYPLPGTHSQSVLLQICSK